MIRSLRWKFVAAMMGIVTVILAAALILFYRSTWVNLQQDTASALVQAAQESLSRAPWDNSRQPLLPFFVVEVDSEGNVLESRPGFFSFEKEAVPQEMNLEVIRRPENLGTLEDYGLTYYRIQGREPASWRIVYADRSFETSTMENLVRTLVLVGGGAWVLFLLLSIALSRWMTKPVERAWQQQKQFVADASHELKTPLTVILSSAQMIASRRSTAPAEAVQRWTENIQAEGTRMRGLVEDMLTLARSDSQSPQKQTARLCLGEEVESAVLPFEPIAFERGLTIQSQLCQESYVLGDGEGIRRLCGVLLDNAVKYCAPGGEIQVTLAPDGGNKYWLLTVENDGASIDQKDLKRIFDRFYRSDPARVNHGGYGLGLAIARQIVLRHKGKIWAENRPGKVAFLVRLPQAR